MAFFACAIPPLDQSTTSMGWWPGLFVYASCPASGPCGFQDPSLQFLADPGTPVVAPFTMTVTQTSPMLLVRPDPTVPTNNLTLRMTGITPAVSVGTTLQKGDLIGRIAAGQRGTKWVLWGPGTDGTVGQQDGVATMFNQLGLVVVGSTRPDLAQYRTISSFGGHMYARTGDIADCSSSAVHGLSKGLAAYLGSAPSGYAQTPSSVYSRYGTSSQSDNSVPNPLHENALVQITTAQAAGGGALALLGLGLAVAWALRNG